MKKKKEKGFFHNHSKKIIITGIILGILILGLILTTRFNLVGFAIRDISDDEDLITNSQIPFEESSGQKSPGLEEVNLTTTTTPLINSTNLTTVPKKTPSGGGGGGGGDPPPPPPPPCTPTLTCLNHSEQCGTELTNGCVNILNCTNNCNIGYFCNSSFFCEEVITCTGECLGVQINSCQQLNLTNGNYVLNESIINNTLSDNCINITAENITLDCQGNYILSDKAYTGIYSNSSNTTIKNCNISMSSNTGGYGIKTTGDNTNIINNILNLQYSGIHLSLNSNNFIENNTINNNSNNGIQLTLSSNNSIVNNTLNNGSFHGILMTLNSSNNLIQNNDITFNGWYGIHLGSASSSEFDFSNYNQIINNNINQNGIGIYIETSNNIFENNFINGSSGQSTSSHGLYVFGNYGGHNNTITNNTITHSEGVGLRIRYSQNNTITNNTVENNERYGIEVGTSGLYNTLLNNRICSNSLADTVCSLDQSVFNFNYCDSGTVCGGACIACT